jgi:xylose dehydrogenase (NAD/NADP)
VVPAISASRRGRLVSIASRDGERARELASVHSFARVGVSYNEVIDDPEVDAVYIPLINSLHREWTLRSLAAGKHVLCEKPLAMNAAEAEEMSSAADRAGLLLMEAFMYRFHPRTSAFIQSVQHPLHTNAWFGFTLSDPSNYRARASLGGGALLDVGCYAISATRWILGEPNEVFARIRRGGSGTDSVDMSVAALLHFPSGATASVWVSMESPEVQGLEVVERGALKSLERPFTWRDADNPYLLMVESFAKSVIEGQPPAIPTSESVANMRVIDRIRDAADAVLSR